MKAKPHEDMELTFHFNDPYIRSQICLTAVLYENTSFGGGVCCDGRDDVIIRHRATTPPGDLHWRSSHGIIKFEIY